MEFRARFNISIYLLVPIIFVGLVILSSLVTHELAIGRLEFMGFRSWMIIIGLVSLVCGLVVTLVIVQPVYKFVREAEALSFFPRDVIEQQKDSNPDEIAYFTNVFQQVLHLLHAHAKDIGMKESSTFFNQLKTVDQLASLGFHALNLAHEIRNPLGSIQGLVELIGKREISKEKQDEYVGVILSSIDRLNKLVEGLLAFSGRWSEIPLYTDVNDLLRKTLDLYRNQLNEKRIAVKENYSQDLAPCETHLDKMQMALGNIIQNALHQTPEGGTIEVGTRYNPEAPEEFLIEIFNSGSFIQPDDLEKVFNPFFTTKADGTGLGLSLALYVIQKQRGDIKVTSEPGRGTTFTVNLPVRQS